MDIRHRIGLSSKPVLPWQLAAGGWAPSVSASSFAPSSANRTWTHRRGRDMMPDGSRDASDDATKG